MDLAFVSIIPSGSIFRKLNKWQFQLKKRNVCATFSSKKDAKRYQTTLSDQLGENKVRFLSYADIGIHIPNDIVQICCGFIDGDGCIRLTVNHGYGMLEISISQSCSSGIPQELLFIRKYYGGGNIKHDANPKNENQRQHWKLRISRQTQVLRLLRDMAMHCVLKADQARVALEWQDNGRKNPLECKAILHSMNQKPSYQKVQIDSSRLNLPYISGLFVADGCCCVNGASGVSIFAQITKRGSPRLLEELSVFFGFGSVRSAKDWFCTGQNAVTFLQEIRPYCFGAKVSQLDLLIDWVLWDDRKFARMKRESVKIECERLKKL
jgi:hypothetical protein